MSFDVYFMKFARGQGADLPRQPVRSLLENQVFQQTGEDYYDIRFPDGSHVECSATGLSGPGNFDSCVFYIRGMSDAIVSLAFEIARTAGCVMIPTMENNPCIMVDTNQRTELPSNFNLPIVECQSAEQLGRLLGGGYKNWSRDRDQVIGSNDKSNPAAWPFSGTSPTQNAESAGKVDFFSMSPSQKSPRSIPNFIGAFGVLDGVYALDVGAWRFFSVSKKN
jgi:hypothetical protein